MLERSGPMAILSSALSTIFRKQVLNFNFGVHLRTFLILFSTVRTRAEHASWSGAREIVLASNFGLNSEMASRARRPVKKFVDFARYSEACRMIAGRADSSDRELLLEMAEAWATAIRRMRSDARQAKDRNQ